MGGKEKIASLLQSQTFQNIALIDPFLWTDRTSLMGLPVTKIVFPSTPCSANTDGNARYRQINITDMIHDLPVDHFADIPIPAPVSRLHMKNRDFQRFAEIVASAELVSPNTTAPPVFPAPVEQLLAMILPIVSPRSFPAQSSNDPADAAPDPQRNVAQGRIPVLTGMRTTIWLK